MSCSNLPIFQSSNLPVFLRQESDSGSVGRSVRRRQGKGSQLKYVVCSVLLSLFTSSSSIQKPYHSKSLPCSSQDRTHSRSQKKSYRTIMFGGKRFDPDKEIPDLTAKTILVTGGMYIRIGLSIQRNPLKFGAR